MKTGSMIKLISILMIVLLSGCSKRETPAESTDLSVESPADADQQVQPSPSASDTSGNDEVNQAAIPEKAELPPESKNTVDNDVPAPEPSPPNVIPASPPETETSESGIAARSPDPVANEESDAVRDEESDTASDGENDTDSDEESGTASDGENDTPTEENNPIKEVKESLPDNISIDTGTNEAENAARKAVTQFEENKDETIDDIRGRALESIPNLSN